VCFGSAAFCSQAFDPVASAGPDQTVVSGSVVTLDGSASEGDIDSYSWALDTFEFRPDAMEPCYRSAMRKELVGLVLLVTAGAAAAQAPARDAIEREQALSSAQQRAGAAYQEMQQARQNAIRAEGDFLNAQEADRAAQKQAAETKQQLDAARQALDAAKARDAKARKAYDDALDAVDRARKAPAAR
jgi:hypothetical protein